MELIKSLKSLILERIFLDSFTSNNVRVNIFYNEHSRGVGGGVSSLSRVGKEQILKSLLEVKDVIVKVSFRILENCEGKQCSFIIRDEADGVDSHFWVKLTKEGRLNLILNTSINHPRKLYNTTKVPVINVDMIGDITIMESKNTYIVGKKIIKIENLN
jgi:hypothetical protein